MKRTLALLTIIFLLLAPAALPAQTAAALIRQGDALEARLQTQEALDAFLQAEQLVSPPPDLLVRISKQYSGLMEDAPNRPAKKALGEKSLAYAQKALALDPNHADANLSLAVCYGKLTPFMGNKEKVAASKLIKQYADRAITLDPKSDYAHHLLGRWNQELASMGGLQKSLAKLIYGGLPDASFDKALKEFDQARKLRPDRLIHQVEYARTLALLGRKEEAKRALEKALALPNKEKDDPEAKARARQTLAEISE
jgi:tetratricopeptide (TPR) repeat protein